MREIARGQSDAPRDGRARGGDARGVWIERGVECGDARTFEDVGGDARGEMADAPTQVPGERQVDRSIARHGGDGSVSTAISRERAMCSQRV